MMETENELLNTFCRKPTSHRPATQIIHIVLSSISLLTVVLNLFVIISVSHFRQLHTPTDLLLLSLAVSDFLLGLTIPVEILRQTSCWFLSDVLCLLHNYMSYIITSVSTGNIVLISVDRYVAICDPLYYPARITVRRVKMCIYLSCSVLYSILILQNYLTQPGRYNSCYGECVIVLGYSAGAVDFLLTFIIPITVIIVLYMRVFVVALSQARAMRCHVATAKLSVTTRKSELKAARTLGVLVLVYLICFCPYYCVSLVPDCFSNSVLPATLLLLLLCLNPCLNPLIYALFYPWFRKAIGLIVTLQILQPGSREANIM